MSRKERLIRLLTMIRESNGIKNTKDIEDMAMKGLEILNDEEAEELIKSFEDIILEEV